MLLPEPILDSLPEQRRLLQDFVELAARNHSCMHVVQLIALLTAQVEVGGKRGESCRIHSLECQERIVVASARSLHAVTRRADGQGRQSPGCIVGPVESPVVGHCLNYGVGECASGDFPLRSYLGRCDLLPSHAPLFQELFPGHLRFPR